MTEPQNPDDSILQASKNKIRGWQWVEANFLFEYAKWKQLH